jgi:hypothetical protein
LSNINKYIDKKVDCLVEIVKKLRGADIVRNFSHAARNLLGISNFFRNFRNLSGISGILKKKDFRNFKKKNNFKNFLLILGFFEEFSGISRNFSNFYGSYVISRISGKITEFQEFRKKSYFRNF